MEPDQEGKDFTVFDRIIKNPSDVPSVIEYYLTVNMAKQLSTRFSPVPRYWDEHPLCPEIEEIAIGSFKRRNPPEIKGSGYVVKSLEAALWALYHTDNFKDGCLAAANLGDDADTTGAVYGQIAGAYYGKNGIPQEWLEKLAHRELIMTFAERLFELAQTLSAQAK